MSNVCVFIAEEADAGLRLDKFLAAKMPEFSRSEVQKFTVARIAGGCSSSFALRSGHGGKIKLSDKIRAGDEFEVTVPEKASCALQPAARSSKCSLDILHEDDDIIVINKPRGVSMYPGAGREDDTIVQRVLAHAPLSALGGDMRPGIVHRLDKDTSGVVVLAKSDAAHRALTKTFAAHDLTRKYIAFVWGVPNWAEADIEGNIGRSARNRQKMTMLKAGGKPAKTKAEVIDAWAAAGISKLRCMLLTGRTHQIRVHLSMHGFPVLCDPVYGRGAARLGSVKNPELLEFLKTHNRQMLHAEVLEFKHPVSGALLKFKTRLPDDMKELQSIIADR